MTLPMTVPAKSASLLLLAAIMLVSLGGCATNGPASSAAIGGLTLHRALEIPANRARVYVQGGRVVPHAEINIYHAHCMIEVRDVRDTPQPVQAGEFAIYRTSRDINYGVDAGTLRLAALASSETSHLMYATHFYLRSAEQPQVWRLSCQHYEIPWRSQYLPISAMRTALGGVATLRLDEK